MAAQPMQMFMVAPMAAPVMMPNFDASMGSGSVDFSAMTSNLASTAFPLTYPGAWQEYIGDSFFGEEAVPQQLPMEAVAPQELKAEPLLANAHWDVAVEADAGNSQEKVPSQIQMDSTTSQPLAQKNAAAALKTLRRRRGQECFCQESHATCADLFNFGEPHAEQEHEEAETAGNDAQAQEIASHFIDQLQAGGNARRSALAGFERLAFTSKVTSRAAQLILDQTSMTDKAACVASLRGHIRNAVQSKHANHVVQKIIEVMPVALANFAVDELKGFGQEIAQHPFGCRVLCRILEHLSPTDTSTIELVEEMLMNIDELCSHSFGSFVVRHLLEFGLPEHRHRVVMALRMNLAGQAKHKFGSHVVESALRNASPDDKEMLARDLMWDKEQLMVLAANQFGRHVVRAMLAMPSGLKKEVVQTLRSMEDQLRSSRYGKSVWQALRATASA